MVSEDGDDHDAQDTGCFRIEDDCGGGLFRAITIIISMRLVGIRRVTRIRNVMVMVVIDRR
jgi:hypothetical protein